MLTGCPPFEFDSSRCMKLHIQKSSKAASRTLCISRAGILLLHGFEKQQAWVHYQHARPAFRRLNFLSSGRLWSLTPTSLPRKAAGRSSGVGASCFLSLSSLGRGRSHHKRSIRSHTVTLRENRFVLQSKHACITVLGRLQLPTICDSIFLFWLLRSSCCYCLRPPFPAITASRTSSRQPLPQKETKQFDLPTNIRTALRSSNHGGSIQKGV